MLKLFKIAYGSIRISQKRREYFMSSSFDFIWIGAFFISSSSTENRMFCWYSIINKLSSVSGSILGVLFISSMFALNSMRL